MTRHEFIEDLAENFTEIDFTDIQGIDAGGKPVTVQKM